MTEILPGDGKVIIDHKTRKKSGRGGMASESGRAMRAPAWLDPRERSKENMGR
jgi:hypothetical protein